MNDEYKKREEEQREGSCWCYFHPREMVIGVCALCLKERLLVLAASKQQHQTNTIATPKKVLSKIFALTSLINNPLDNNNIIHHKSSSTHHHHHHDTNSSSTSQEDSFISIKFEDNIGVASWDHKAKIISKISSNDDDDHHHHQMSWNHDNIIKNKNVVEHGKPRAATLRWRKRIGHLLHLIRWKRQSASKGNICPHHHVGTKLEGSKVKHGWIRILTKRRTK